MHISVEFYRSSSMICAIYQSGNSVVSIGLLVAAVVPFVTVIFIVTVVVILLLLFLLLLLLLLTLRLLLPQLCCRQILLDV